jgi:hypothetical protein
MTCMGVSKKTMQLLIPKKMDHETKCSKIHKDFSKLKRSKLKNIIIIIIIINTMHGKNIYR